ncbi:MAG: hypothetical protein AAFN59_09915, partial [Pseudomonadota bacterium]
GHVCSPVSPQREVLVSTALGHKGLLTWLANYTQALMEILVWLGAALTCLGLVGLGACIIIVRRARRDGLEEAEMRDRLQRVVALNLGALAVSAIGLMCVVLGVMLG